MPYFMTQVSYSQASAKAMTENPQDRAEVIKKTVESAGGRMHSMFYSFGEFDVVLIEEWPDMKAAAALSMAVAGTGAVSRIMTTPLLTPEEGLEVMRASRSIAYTKPQ
jgi:uncharacterized protein with GYD domain